MIDLGGVDEDPVVVVEFVPVVGRVDVRVGGVQWIGSRLAGHAAIFVPITIKSFGDREMGRLQC